MDSVNSMYDPEGLQKLGKNPELDTHKTSNDIIAEDGIEWFLIE